MRPNRFAATVLLTYSTTIACGGGGGYQQNTPPPPLPPGVSAFTLTSAIHELRDAQNNIVRKSEEHFEVTPKIWQQCAISIVWATTIVQNIDGRDPTNFQNAIIRLGERFYATEADGRNHQVNWPNIEEAGFRWGQARAKGSDSYYSRMILEWDGSAWNTNAAGITPVTTSPPENYSVLEPTSGGNNQFNMAHEMGHQLGLDEDDTSGGVMCRFVSCTGTFLEGSIYYPNPLAPGTQCVKARDHGDFWNMFEEG